MNDVAVLLDNLNIHPKPIRLNSSNTKGSVARGYLRADLQAAAKLVGLR
jgi:hypothetical protein